MHNVTSKAAEYGTVLASIPLLSVFTEGLQPVVSHTGIISLVTIILQIIASRYAKKQERINLELKIKLEEAERKNLILEQQKNNK